MFRATKVVVTGAIVALISGFLLAGVLTQPSEEAVPGAVTESPSPTTTEELLSGMTTEQAEPGVYRVVSDGIRDVSSAADERGAQDIVAGVDGSVWWLGPDAFFRLGGDTTHAWPESDWQRHYAGEDLAVTPDGKLLRLATPFLDTGREVVSFDGQSWTELGNGSAVAELGEPAWVGGLAAEGDGTVWTTLVVDDGFSGVPSELAVMRLTEDGWEQVPGPDDPLEWLRPVAARGAESEVWLVGETVLYRLGDGGWQRHSPPHLVSWADVGPDGTVWIGRNHNVTGEPRTARFDGREWTEYAAGLNGGHVYEGGGGWFQAGPDGRVWFNPGDGGGCDGVAAFDGESLDHFLRDMCIFAMDVAPDGHVWLQAGLDDATRPIVMHTYVITPEAVVATE